MNLIGKRSINLEIVDIEKFKNSAKNLTKLEIEKLKEVSIEDELNRL